MMKKNRIIALMAAVLTAGAAFSGCGNKDESGEEGVETSINVVSDGTQADASDTEGGSGNDPDFSDPASALGVDMSPEGGGQEEEDPAVTTLPGNHDDIVNMISQGEITQAKEPVLKEYNVDHTTRYGYNQLSDAEKKLYTDILEGAKSLKTRVIVDDSVTDEMWVKVYGCVSLQEPQLFWFSSQKIFKGKLRYWEVDTELIASMQSEIDASVGKILAQAEGKSDYEKLKIFHDSIVLSNDFVKELGFNHTIYGAFCGGKIQCEGYAKAMQYLCDLSGIESMTVAGTNESGDSHAWNVVKVDGNWYNLDCTWDDPILTEVDKTNIRYRYFLVPDEWIHNKSHFNVNQKTTGTQVTYFTPPACTSDAMNYFNVTKQLYSDKASADAALKDKMKSAAASKLRAAEIRVSSKDVYDAVTADLKGYASWIKEQDSSVSSVVSNCDPNTLVIELDLVY